MISQEIKMLQIAQREVFRALDSGDIDEAKKLLKPMFKLYNETLEMLNKFGEENKDDSVGDNEEDFVIKWAKDYVKRGKKLDIRGSNGGTALHIAAAKSFMRLADFLLDHSVDVNLRDNDGHSPIFFAVRTGSIEMVELLIKRGADLHVKNKFDITLLDIAKDRAIPSIVWLLEEKMQEQAK